MQKRIALLALFGFVATIASFAQKPSPPESATCELGGGKSVKTNYSSPRMKGRKIYGELVPFGEVWRTGANEATTFVASSDITVGGKSVPAGNYTLFVVPNADKWTLIVNKKTGEWGIPYKYESDELDRIDMQVSQLPSPLEDFTIAYGQSGDACTLQMDWATTRASVTLAEKR